MSFHSITKIINFVEQQPDWALVRQYRYVLQCWKTVVPAHVIEHTRPLFVNRQVLWVATSSSAWAQNLSLQRYSLLKKLNSQLPEPLSDIRFSPASWYNSPKIDDTDNSTQAKVIEQHPSFVGNPQNLTAMAESSPSTDDPKQVFQRWAQKRQQALQFLPLCPHCHCPTPVGELERWSVCACCAVEQWSSNRE